VSYHSSTEDVRILRDKSAWHHRYFVLFENGSKRSADGDPDGAVRRVSCLLALGWAGPHSGTDNCPTSIAMSLDPGRPCQWNDCACAEQCLPMEPPAWNPSTMRTCPNRCRPLSWNCDASTQMPIACLISRIYHPLPLPPNRARAHSYLDVHETRDI
jgi:hypothetical protein